MPTCNMCTPLAGVQTTGKEAFERVQATKTSQGVSYRVYMPPGSAAMVSMTPTGGRRSV